MRSLLKLSFIAAFALLASCSIHVQNNITANTNLTFEVLKQDAYGGRDQESTVIVTSQGQLNSLYKELGWETVPAIDFDQYTVVALFMGQKNTGGYSIGIRKISIEGDTTILEVSETAPSGMATMAITAPYCIALIPKTQNIEVK